MPKGVDTDVAVADEKVRAGDPTDDELGNLSDEERAALEEEEGADPDDPGVADADPDDDAADRKEGGGDEPTEGADPSDPGSDAAGEGEDDVPAEGADEPDDSRDVARRDQTLPQYAVPEVPENAEARIAEINTERTQLFEQHENGDIADAEFYAKLEELADEKMALLIAQNNAKTVQSINEQNQERDQRSAEQQWEDAQAAFYGREGNDIFDPSNKEHKPVLFSALNGEVQRLSGMEENAGRSFDWLLDTAAANVRAELAIVQAGRTKPEDKPATKPEDKPAKPKKTVKARNAPTTLGDAPVAEANEPDEFADIDELEGMEIEQAVARMTPEQRRRFLET